ncbi:MAG: ABC transporter ATP-binding protein [Pseudomonadota bacterium]
MSLGFDGHVAVADISLSVAPGEILCLLGPSGCGKSTTLRIAAGVERQAEGRVLIDGAVVSDAARHQPPETRGVGLMFQDFALFPHLSVGENVAFGLRRRLPPRERATIVQRQLARVDLAHMAARYPHQLSGGEQQRVALARALAPGPRVMLMDEPFSGLDTRLRDEVREQTLGVLRDSGTAVMLVTHEPGEAMGMGDRIALMRSGRIVQQGAPYNVYNHPVDRAAASFFSDVNVIAGTVRAGQTATPFGPFLCPGMAEGAPVEIVFRPQHLAIAPASEGAPEPGAEHGTPAEGRVLRARFLGAFSQIDVATVEGGSVLRATVPHTWLPPGGTPVWLSLRRDRCFVFPGTAGSASAGAAARPQAAE